MIVTWNFVKASKIKKKSVMKKVKTVLGKTLPYKYRSKPASVSGAGFPTYKETSLSNTKSLLPRVLKKLPSPKLFIKPRMGKLSEHGNQRQRIVKPQGQ